MKVLSRYAWTRSMDEGEEAALLNALMRGVLRAAYAYVWLTGDRETVKKVCKRVLEMKASRDVKKRVRWLLENVDRLTFEERKRWIVVHVGERVVGYLPRER